MQHTVLLTRPEHQNEAISKLMQEAGYRVLVIPMLEILPVDPGEAGKQIAMDLDQYDHIIFVSRNGVDLGFTFIQQYWPQWPAALDWYAVGAATASALAEFDVEVVQPTDATSEGLLALPALSRVDSSKILIVRGQGGRTALGEELGRRGATVEYLEVYRRQKVSLSEQGRRALDEAKPMIAPVYSGETLEALAANLADDRDGISLVVPSDRVSDVAAALGFASVMRAASAKDEDMFIATSALIEEGQ